MKDKIYVVDTNIILQNLQNLYKISQNKTNHIVVPETVLLELEDKKKLSNELGYYAREFARLLALMKIKEVDYKLGFKVVKLYNEELNLDIISKDKYDTQIEQLHLSESNDKRIIETACIARDYYKGSQTIFLSLDVYARTFALFESIKTETLHDDKSTVPKFAFVKKFELDSSIFNSLDKKNIKEIDVDYEKENFSYIFQSLDGNSEHAVIYNDKIDTLKETDFKALSIKPVNLKQKLFTKAIISNMYELLVIDAKAGSGKTLMSVVCAMRLIDLGFYDKIIYVRNSIESLDKGEDIGYLSGNDEKFRIYNMAIQDTLEFIAKKQLKKSENRDNPQSIETKISDLQNKYCIETLWPGEARGRTISGAIVIMDEWQNSSEKTTQLILSRLDESCMAIVIGSNRQIDNLYLNKYNNGLTTLLKQTNETHPELKMFAIELDKAVRGKFAQFTERIFEKKSD
ncbi:PhoH family protein [Poseidonibacter lekithochrous]|uniref:PhoH family protein n=1 Tax=Poseidonibacter TaxID=2321187 RepID=UPI001C08B8CA|nr:MULTISPECIES: PhoH family protein [Poseidonibacter]MBU3013231.1 PhoH family protein [Poseidonibacter lekithochrous]MDO6826528.1 PhoH family protein [Poseidonibacter sp. 1_MG-2023]